MNVFFARSKPYGVDAVEIARDNKVIFIGYPLLKIGASYDPDNLNSSLVSLRASDEEWQTAKDAMSPAYRKAAQANRNLAMDIQPGDIALLPHAREGVVYAGVVVAGFEIVASPPWLRFFGAAGARRALPGRRSWSARG